MPPQLWRTESSESALPSGLNSSKHQSARKNGGQYTIEEVARHNQKDDAWLIYNNQVVDVSKWVSIPEESDHLTVWLIFSHRLFSPSK